MFCIDFALGAVFFLVTASPLYTGPSKGIQWQRPNSRSCVSGSYQRAFCRRSTVETGWYRATVVHPPIEVRKRARRSPPWVNEDMPNAVFLLLYKHTLDIASAV